MGLLRYAAKLYVRFPLLWMTFVAAAVLLLAREVVHSGTKLDTTVDSFVVRGTELSMRDKTSHAIGEYLWHFPRHTHPPEPAASSRQADTLASEGHPRDHCSNHSRELTVLVTDESDNHNILSHEGLLRLCHLVEHVEATETWRRHCAGDAVLSETEWSDEPQCVVEECDTPVYLLSLPSLLHSRHSPSSFRKMLRTLRGAGMFLGATEYLKQTCNTTGTVPCDIRAPLGCDAPGTSPGSSSCAAPCELSGMDLCGLLLATNASEPELRALSDFPDDTPETCAGMTPEYMDRVLSAAQVLAAWAKRSSLASKILPRSGGRALFDTHATDAAAARTVELGGMKSRTTRVIFGVQDDNGDAELLSGVRQLSDLAAHAEGDYGVSVAWREPHFFDVQLRNQMFVDGRWAVGSVTFVLAFIVLYSRDVVLSLGAVVGVLLCLPVSFYLYQLFGVRWVGVLHCIGLFLVAGIGADDFFVLLAHWRDEGRRDPRASEEVRLERTMRHSLQTVTATSLTTAGAFLGNCASHIAPIKLFGLFMALLMLSLLLIVALWFPPLLILAARINRKVEWLLQATGCRSHATAAYHSLPASGDSDDDMPHGGGASGAISLQNASELGAGDSTDDFLSDAPHPEEGRAGGAGGGGMAGAPLNISFGSDGDAYSDDSNVMSFDEVEGEGEFFGSMPGSGRSPREEKRQSRHAPSLLRRLIVAVTSHYRGVAAAAAVCLAASVVLALNLPGPNGELSLWPKHHNQARYLDTELTMDIDVGRAMMRMTWGLVPQDDGNLLDPSSATHVKVDETFNMSDPACQMHLLRVCKDLGDPQSSVAHMVRAGSLWCPMLDIDTFLRKDKNTSLPLQPEEFDRVSAEWFHKKGRTHYAGIYYWRNPDEGMPQRALVYTVWVGTSINWRQPFTEIRPDWVDWEEWMERFNSLAPATGNKGFQTAGSVWVVMETQQELQRTAFLSLAVSLFLALAILTLVTRNVIVSVTATACIASSVTVFIAFMTCAGWNLGVIESICMTIVVGMSCDYVVHIATLHASIIRDGEKRSESSFQPRHIRHIRYVKKTMILIGPPVIAAAVTSVGSAAFLIGCTIVFLFKFGAFVAVTLVSAGLSAAVVYPVVMLTLSSFGLNLHACSWEWCTVAAPCSAGAEDGEEAEESGGPHAFADRSDIISLGTMQDRI